MFLGDTLRAHGRGDADDRALRRALWTAAVGVIPVSLMAYGDEGWRYVLCYEAAIATFTLCWRRAAAFEVAGARKRVLDFLGDISYGMYLNSSSILLWLGDSMMRSTNNRLLTAAATLPTVLLVSWLSCRFAEAPCIRMGRRLTPVLAA
jgi:peptidoglycan/LPS O-acetylase OafA/YrhL